MADRYYIPPPIDPRRTILDGPEARHLIRVMRARLGDAVTLFDGAGAEYEARIVRLGRDEVELETGPRREVDRESPRPVTLAVALPKGDRQRWLVEKAVELGVSRLAPLHTSRGVAQGGEAAAARLKRWTIEASKQCGRTRLLEIAPPAAWPDFLRQATSATLLAAHPGGRPLASWRETIPASGPVVLAVGPEGGFDAAEIEQAEAAGALIVDLGPRLLRVETAALFLVAAVNLAASAAPA